MKTNDKKERKHPIIGSLFDPRALEYVVIGLVDVQGNLRTSARGTWSARRRPQRGLEQPLPPWPVEGSGERT